MTRACSPSSTTRGIVGFWDRVKTSTATPMRASSRASSRTYTFIPPVSLPPSAASGQVCTLSIAIRVGPTRPALGIPGSGRDGHAVEVFGLGPEVVLVALLAPQEIEPPLAPDDRVADHVAQEHQAWRECG